jgi:hypothetical protein
MGAPSHAIATAALGIIEWLVGDDAGRSDMLGYRDAYAAPNLSRQLVAGEDSAAF